LHGTLRLGSDRGVEFNLNAYWDEVAGGNTAYQYLSGPDDYHLDNQLNYNSFAKFTYKGANLKGEFDIGSSNKLTIIGAYDKRDQDSDPLGRRLRSVRLPEGRRHGRPRDQDREVRLDTQLERQRLDAVRAVREQHVQRAAQRDDARAVSSIRPGWFEGDERLPGRVRQRVLEVRRHLGTLAGLRYDHQKVEITTSPDTYDTDEWEPRLSLTKHWSDAVMTYASVARGFRGGGTNGPERRTRSTRATRCGRRARQQVGAARPELALNAAIFYNDYSDFIGQNGWRPASAARASSRST
jgi:iron complex outermembrane receptor protein